MVPRIIITLAIIFYITNQAESSSLTSEKDEENSELNQSDFSSQEIEETTTLENSESTSHHHHDHKFDFILFAQVWPISNCIDWEERSDDNTCSLPNRKQWTVHGIWPTKNFTIGPLFCNHSAHFDFNALSPILEDLKLHWTNVRANSKLDNFWFHEWTKHGTCAMQLEEVNTEIKYFKKGLELNKEFPLAKFLSDANIVPGAVYQTEDILQAVKSQLNGMNPALECHQMDEFSDPVLTQIGICLDKKFQVIGCELTHGGIYGKCPKSGAVEYPATEKLKYQTGRRGIHPAPLEAGHAGLIWGIIIGCAILIGFITYFLKSKCDNYVRNSAYEAL